MLLGALLCSVFLAPRLFAYFCVLFVLSVALAGAGRWELALENVETPPRDHAVASAEVKLALPMVM